MPIVDVLVVHRGLDDESLPSAPALADALGNVFGAAPGHVWVRLAGLARERYAENGVAAGDTPAPVFVTVLHARPPEGAARAAEALAVASAVARACGRAVDQVHVEYAAPGRGRIAFGGRLLA
ncbi:MAG: hypothetical protein JNN18_18680 [Rubrivivax sp.]|nr:hypothetical protein [Rubrivivax sp.]